MSLNNYLKEVFMKERLISNNSLFVYDRKDIAIKILFFSILLILISHTFQFDKSSFFFISNIKFFVYTLLFISFAIFLSIEKIKKEEIILISIIFILMYIFLMIESFFTKIELKLFIKPILILPFFFYSIFDTKYRKEIFSMLLIFLVFTFIYSTRQDFFIGNRFVSNSDNSSIVALYLLFAFYLARKINSKILMYLFLLLGIFTLSRNFILAILVLYTFSYLKQIKKISKLIKINFVTLLVILTIVLVSFSFSVKNINFNEGANFSYSRLTDVLDESNYIRFKINRDVIYHLFSSSENFLFGLGEDYPRNEKYNINYKAHSGLLDFLTMYGFIYSSLMLSVLYLIIKSSVNHQNIEYIYSYCIFSLFLPGAFSGVYLILFLFTLKIK